MKTAMQTSRAVKAQKSRDKSQLTNTSQNITGGRTPLPGRNVDVKLVWPAKRRGNPYLRVGDSIGTKKGITQEGGLARAAGGKHWFEPRVEEKEVTRGRKKVEGSATQTGPSQGTRALIFP